MLVLTHLRRAAEDVAKIGVGDRVLARITRLEEPDVEGARYEAEPIKVLPRDKRRLLGIFRKSARGGTALPSYGRASRLLSWC